MSNIERTELVTAQAVATQLAVSRAWVYDHQTELGAIRVGSAVRFDTRAIEAYLDARRVQTPGRATPARRGPRRRPHDVELLPLPGNTVRP